MQGYRSVPRLLLDTVPIIVQAALVLLSLSAGFEASTLSTFVYFIVFSFMTPYYLASMIGGRFNMDDLEVVCVSLFLGSAINMTVYILLTQILVEVSRPLFLSVLTGLSLCSFLFHVMYRRRRVEEGASFMKKVLDVLAAYLSALTGFYLILRVIPRLYWRGPDAWETASVVRTIVTRSLDPGEAISYFYGYVYLWNAGFYYYLSAVQLIAGASVENLLRYGGAFSAGAVCFLTFIVVRRLAGSLAGLLSGLLLFTNPMYLTRFVTPLREDYGFVLLILALFFFKVREDLEAERPNFLYVSIMGFIFASSVVIHLLPSLFLFTMLALHTLYYWLKEETALVKENVYIILASCFFVSYYVIYLEESLAWFIGVVMEGGVFLILVPLASIIFIWYVKSAKPEVEKYRTIGVLLSLLVIFINLFFSSEKSGSFRALSLDMFSGATLLIGSYELLGNRDKMPLFVSSLIIVTGFFTAFSYVGVVVPIERFSVYLSWMAVYLCTSYLSRLLSVNWVNVSSLQEIVKFRRMRPEIILLVVLVLTTSLGGALQTRQYPYYFDEAEISDTQVFNTKVRTDDLVIPQEPLRHLLYYTETSYDSLVTGVDYREWLTQVYAADSPGELSDLIEARFPQKDRAVFFTTTTRYSIYDDLFVNRSILDGYCREYLIGHVRYFIMDIPYIRNNVPVEKIRNVAVDTGKQILVVADNDVITSIGNVYFNHDNRYLMLYTMEGGLWSAVSLDGVIWTLEGVQLLEGGYLNPYIVESGGRYHLFIEDLSLRSITHYVSEDAYHWDRSGDLGGLPANSLFYGAESPVAWVEGDAIHVLFWETAVTEDAPRSELRCLESRDGMSWRDAQYNTDWKLITDQYNAVEYRKIMLSEVFTSEGEPVFIGRYLTEGSGGSSSWSLGAFKPDLDTGSMRVVVSSINIKPIDGPATVRLCRVWRDPSKGALDFYIMFEDDSTGVYKGSLGD